MIYLSGGCRCSELTVHPRNWQSRSADPTLTWYISYRFYDPAFPRPKQRILKGMNDVKTLKEKQEITRQILAIELDLLTNRSYNPFTGDFKEDTDLTTLNPGTPFIKALRAATALLEVSDTTLRDIRSVLKYVSKAAEKLRMDNIPINDITRKDIRELLAAVGQLKKSAWTANNFNYYRAHLGMLFKALIKEEVLENNPVLKLDKKKVEKKLRTVLTTAERSLIDQHLADHYPAFRRWVHIFFHSGARITELQQVKGEHVELERQRFKVLVKKRNRPTWVWKIIKDVAVPYWQEAVQHCGKEDYLFSLAFQPGSRRIDSSVVTKTWNRHVKKRLGINVDLYSLKHLHTTEVLDIRDNAEGLKEIAEHNAHLSTAMVVKIYDVNQEGRQAGRLKRLQNKFA